MSPSASMFADDKIAIISMHSRVMYSAHLCPELVEWLADVRRTERAP